jgi:Zn-dependent peptidase ImmA (M78 family)
MRFGIRCVPISGFEIALRMGVKVIPYSAFTPEKRGLLLKKSEDGFSVEKEPGQWFIYYNDTRGYKRTNNTIMHEIGHIVLDHSEDSALAEMEVNFFAKYALVPPVLVHKFGLSDPRRISDVFEVSLEAASYALDYYRKWLLYGGKGYKHYELLLLNQFEDAG